MSAREKRLGSDTPVRSRTSIGRPTAESRHKEPENAKRYVTSSTQAVRERTSLLAPGADRR